MPPSFSVACLGFPITALREVKILRQLNHPNIVNLMGIVSDKDRAEQHVLDLESREELKRGRDFYMVSKNRVWDGGRKVMTRRSEHEMVQRRLEHVQGTSRGVRSALQG